MKHLETSWFVITGGPSSGKTTLLEYLKSLGYAILPETARTLIDQEVAKGKTILEIRSDERVFQRKVLQMKIDLEESLSPVQLTLLERGIPDSIAYYHFYGEEVTSVIRAAQKRRYKKVFLLEQVPFEKDYARTENRKKALVLSNLLYKAYIDLDYDVVKIPLLSVKQRAAILLEYLKSHAEK